MPNAIVHSRATVGIVSVAVRVETHITNGLPAFSLVGLAEKAVKESKERVRSAIINANFDFPTRRITVNLSPAELPKTGSRFDLAIAISILLASAQVANQQSNDYEFLGELSLDGKLREISAILPAIIHAKQTQTPMVVPSAHCDQLGAVGAETVHHADHLLAVCEFLIGKQVLPHPSAKILTPPQHKLSHDWQEIIGQHTAKRALEIAVSGHHHALMYGPPGSGKTLLAERVPTLLPAPSQNQYLENLLIIDAFGQQTIIHDPLIPYRAPHHSCSEIALVGGGNPIKPGEISLAHNGVLFLDELPEFKGKTLECLREPLETGQIAIARARQRCVFPCRCLLIAAMNPCPCGYYLSQQRECRCPPTRIEQYQAKLSGPLLDRIDLLIPIAPVPVHLLKSTRLGESSATVRNRVQSCQHKQYQRQQKLNGFLTQKEIEHHCQLSDKASATATQALDKFKLSARGYFKVLKVARTIADMDNVSMIDVSHLSEAISYRQSLTYIST